MKKATDFVKQIINMLSGLAKDKTKELKRKTKAFKSRLVIFSLLHNRHMMMSSWSHKLKSNQPSKKLDQDNNNKEEDVIQDQNMVVVYRHNVQAMSSTPVSPHIQYVDEEDEAETEAEAEAEAEAEEEEKYPDLRHSLFEAEGSVIDLVKHSKEHKGEEFRLEDEIDQVADLFISRFHRQMQLQKQLSFESQGTPSPL